MPLSRITDSLLSEYTLENTQASVPDFLLLFNLDFHMSCTRSAELYHVQVVLSCIMCN